MAWIDDVLPQTVIRSAAWGNVIRDRTVHTFASPAERDAQAHPLDGMLCATASDRRLWRYRGDLAKWTILDEPWQGWNVSALVGSGPVQGIQIDLAESRMVGDQVTIRFIGKATAAPGGGGVLYFSLPPGRGNAIPEQLPAGSGTATIYITGLSYSVLFYTEYGRFFARKMSDLTSISFSGGGGDISMSGTFTYRASGYGP